MVNEKRNLTRVAAALAMAVILGGASVANAGNASAITKPHVDTVKPHPVVYPKTSQRAGEEGSVVLRVYVDTDGKPSKIAVAKSSGFQDLDNGAVETALNWSFIPATRNGESVSDWTMVKIDYKLPKLSNRKS